MVSTAVNSNRAENKTDISNIAVSIASILGNTNTLHLLSKLQFSQIKNTLNRLNVPKKSEPPGNETPGVFPSGDDKKYRKI